MSPRQLYQSDSDSFDTPWPIVAGSSLEEVRERAVQALGIHFAKDDLSITELERRLALAFQATSPAALVELTADLPVLGTELNPAAASPPPLVSDEVPERGIIAAIMGGSTRKGSWLVPRHLKVVAVMGGAELDLRQARFAPGVTHIEVLAAMGGVEIIVPSGVYVEALGIAVMGGFETNAGDAAAVEPGQPVLRISGFALVGGVEVKQKFPSTKALTRFGKALRAARTRADKERRRS